MKKLLLASVLIANGCFFAGAIPPGVVPPPPSSEVVPPPPSSEVVPPPPSSGVVPTPPQSANGNTGGNVSSFLEEIQKGIKLKPTKNGENGIYERPDFKDGNYRNNDFNWNEHLKYLEELRKAQNAEKNIFNTLKNTTSTLDESIFMPMRKPNASKEYFSTEIIKVGELFKDVIEFTKKQINLSIPNSEKISFSASDHSNLRVFSRLLKIWDTQCCDALDKILNIIRTNCSIIKNRNIKDISKSAQAIIKEFMGLNGCPNTKLVDFYFRRKDAFNQNFTELQYFIEAFSGEDENVEMIKNALKDMCFCQKTIQSLGELKSKVDKIYKSPFFQYKALFGDLAEQEFERSILNREGEAINRALNSQIKSLDKYSENIDLIARKCNLEVFAFSDTAKRDLSILALKTILEGQNVTNTLSMHQTHNGELLKNTIEEANNVKEYASFVQELIKKGELSSLFQKLENAYQQECFQNELNQKFKITESLVDLQEDHKKYLDKIKENKENSRLTFLLGKKEKQQTEYTAETNWEKNITKYQLSKNSSESNELKKIKILLGWYKTAIIYQIRNLKAKRLKETDKLEAFKQQFKQQFTNITSDDLSDAAGELAKQLANIEINWTDVQLTVSDKENCMDISIEDQKEKKQNDKEEEKRKTEEEKRNRVANEEAIVQAKNEGYGNKKERLKPQAKNATLSNQAVVNPTVAMGINPGQVIIVSLKEKIKELEEKIKTLTNANEALNKDLARQKNRLSIQIDQLNAEKTDLNNRITELQRENIGRVETAKHVARNDIENAVRNEVEGKHNAQIASLNYDNSLALKAKEAEIEKLQNKIASLSQQLVDAGLKPQDVEYVGRGSSTVEENKKDKKQLEITVKHQNEVIIRNEAELKKNADTIKKLEITVNKQRKELEGIKNKNESEDDKNLLEMIEEKQKMMESLQKELEDKETLQNKKQAELDAREKQLKQREQGMNSKNSRNSRLLQKKMNSMSNKNKVESSNKDVKALAAAAA